MTLGKIDKHGVVFGKIEKIMWFRAKLRKLGVILGKIEKTWGDFGQNWEQLGLHSRLFYVIFSNCAPSLVAYRITERVSSWKMFNLKAILGDAWHKNLY